jgi:hypothetical protein
VAVSRELIIGVQEPYLTGGKSHVNSLWIMYEKEKTVRGIRYNGIVDEQKQQQKAF